MEEQNNQDLGKQGLPFWENEFLYFENAISGMQTAIAIMSVMRENALEKIRQLTPAREEVEA